MNRVKQRIIFWGALVAAATAVAQDSMPVEDIGGFMPYEVTGIVETEASEGSGAVVESRRVVASCAHVVFDDTILSSAAGWTNENYFFRAWNAEGFPSEDYRQRLRGYVKWGSYAKSVISLGGDSARAFRDDFVVYYSVSDLFEGTPPERLQQGAAALRTGLEKIISGYPGGLYVSGDPLEYRLHSTGIFTDRLTPELGRYLSAEGPSTGSGNSGGPVWVRDGEGKWDFAGVLVSGLEEVMGNSMDSIGVVGLDKTANRLFDSAVRLGSDAASEAEPEVFTASGDFPVDIPDGSKSGVAIPITVSPAGKKIVEVALSLKISHENVYEDIQVLLRGPNGKTVVVADRPEPTTEDGEFEIAARPIEGFSNSRAAGTWKIIVRDIYSLDEGIVDSASLVLTTR
jgi:subtilisin-like proprotein convertase family protein